MTENFRMPNRQPKSPHAGRSPSRKPPSAGIPPLRFPNVEEGTNGTSYPDAAPSSPLPTSVVEPSVEPSVDPETAEPPIDSPIHSPIGPLRLKIPGLKMPTSWQFWGITLVLAFSGIGILSAVTLLRLPDSPNCPAIFWPTASASLRLYCAQTLADRRTVDDLLRAISLVNGLPKDHPLRPEIDREVEEWSKEILELADESFQQGRLKEAIAIAKRIPKNTAAQPLAVQQIQQWQAVWQNAEKIYKDAEDALRQNDLKQAFRISTRLLSVGNHYWETTKYKELNVRIAATRQDGTKLAKARSLTEQGGLANLQAALKLVDEVKSESYLYEEAKRVVTEIGQAMLSLADHFLEQHDYNQAVAVVKQIPDKAGLQDQIRDFNTLAEARAQSWGGTTDDITSAIMQAQKIERNRPLYGEAQQLISNWQLEIQDVKHLGLARQLAAGGTIGDLTAAIAEARQIPFGNPRANEAQQAIDDWTAQIQTVEDQPYLDQAEQMARIGNVASLEAAINYANRIQPGRALSSKANQRIQDWTAEIQRIQDQPILNQARQLAAQGNWDEAIRVADQIGSGRSLYSDAQNDISQWRSKLEQTQDQPYLAQARQLAAQGDYAGAIATAQQIGSNRSLYRDAQSDIQDWQSQSQGQTRLQQAYNAANLGTPAMLRSAIQIAEQVPEDNPSRAEADRMINRWSWDILDIARSRADFNITEAISIAQNVPSGTDAYDDAQKQIQAWRQSIGQ